MKDTEFAYAVGRVRSNEVKLLSSARLETLINAESYDECLKTLSEAGFEGMDNSDTDKALSQRLKAAFELIYESAPDKSCLDFLVVKNDFHNLKAILKAMVSGTSSENSLLSPSIVDIELLKRSVEECDYSLLPEYISEAALEGYRLATETQDGQTVEVYLDRKCLEACIKLAKDSKDEFSISVAEMFAFLTNVKIALRCIKTGKDRTFLEFALSECDICKKDSLVESCDCGIDGLCVFIRTLGFDKISESITKGFAVFEKACDDLLIQKVKEAKYQCLGIAPLAAYYFATDAEIKTVRIILSCKKNGISEDIIRERVRELYV